MSALQKKGIVRIFHSETKSAGKSDTRSQKMRTLTVIENPNDTLIATLIVHVGSIDESPAQYGISHLLEHMMFATKKSSSKLIQELSSSGAHFNAYTDYDKTQYFVTGHASVHEQILALFRILALEAPDFTELELKREVDVVLEELSWRSDAGDGEDGGSGRQKFNLINEFFWNNTPYEHDIGGSAKTLKGITKDDLVRYYHKYYGDAHLWISAPTSIAAKVRAYVKAEYPRPTGLTATSGCPLVRSYDILKIKAGHNRVSFAVDERNKSTTIVLLMRSVPFDAVQVAYVDFITHALSGLDGVLTRELREGKGFTYGVPVGNVSYVDNGIFKISMVSTQKDVVRLFGAFLEPLAKLRAAGGFSRKEFERIKKSFLLSRATALQDAFELTMTLSHIEFYSGMALHGLAGYTEFLDASLQHDAFSSFAAEFFSFSNANLFMICPQQSQGAIERVVKIFSGFLNAKA